MDDPDPVKQHSLFQSISFFIKSNALIYKKALYLLLNPQPKSLPNTSLANATIIAQSISELWDVNDTEKNKLLTFGKVQNLRIACRLLNGIEVEANQVFSFWRQVGKPSARKGFVIGRELREGCIIPTIGGGLCQLTNALYDVVTQAEFTIVERHKHTKVIKGSLAEQDKDATVKWNYIDLKFTYHQKYRIETELTSSQLIVRLKAIENIEKNKLPLLTTKITPSVLNDCYSCGNTDCFKNRNDIQPITAHGNTTYILDNKWAEYEEFIQKRIEKHDYVIIPIKNTFLKLQQYNWKISNMVNIRSTPFYTLWRALGIRMKNKRKNVFEQKLTYDKHMAKAMAAKIPITTRHLVIQQNLLLYLYEYGVLAGRTYDVLMTRLPIQVIHDRLDLAKELHEDSITLNDFRADVAIIANEYNALTKSRKIITCHYEIAELFKNKVELLQWKTKITEMCQNKGDYILFPAGGFGRKGAFEIKRLAKELNFELTVLHKNAETPQFWNGIKMHYFDGDFSKIKLIVYPVYIESKPVALLKANAMRIPIITTKASGLYPSKGITFTEIGNYQMLKNEVANFLNKTS